MASARSLSGGCSQHFENESEYHNVADESLEDIQDAVEMALEDNDIGADQPLEDQPEVVYASGVLTMGFPPHGTWVLNKQTPNRQIWWSSPISGPKRYEYDVETSEWVYTRSGDANEGDETLTGAIAEEFEQIYGIELDL
jgi:frataxin